MSKKIILGFVGEMASGKGTACDYLIEEHQAGYHRFSTILRDILDRLYIKHSRKNLQQLSTALRQSLGENILAEVMAKQVEADPADIVCVDGIRRPADIEHLNELDNFYLIHISADERTRYERITQRQENPDDQSKTFEQFQKEQQQESERKIADVAAQADIKIDNNGTLQELHQQIEKLLSDLQKE